MFKSLQEHAKGVLYNLIANLIIAAGAAVISWYTAHQAIIAGIPKYIAVLIGIGVFAVLAFSFAAIVWAVSSLQSRKVAVPDDENKEQRDERVYMTREERQALWDERKDANQKYLDIEQAHKACETTITNLQSRVRRLGDDNEIQGIQISVRDADIERLTKDIDGAKWCGIL